MFPDSSKVFSKKNFPSLTPPCRSLAGYIQPCSTLDLPDTSNPALTCCFFCWTNRTWRIRCQTLPCKHWLKEKTGRWEPERGNVCLLQGTVSVCYKVYPVWSSLTSLWWGKQAAAKLCLSRVHLAALGELVLTLLPASPKPLSEQ